MVLKLKFNYTLPKDSQTAIIFNILKGKKDHYCISEICKQRHEILPSLIHSSTWYIFQFSCACPTNTGLNFTVCTLTSMVS